MCVDDILIIGYDLEALSSLRIWLSSQVLNEGLGDASYILVIKLLQDRKNK